MSLKTGSLIYLESRVFPTSRSVWELVPFVYSTKTPEIAVNFMFIHFKKHYCLSIHFDFISDFEHFIQSDS